MGNGVDVGVGIDDAGVPVGASTGVVIGVRIGVGVGLMLVSV